MNSSADTALFFLINHGMANAPFDLLMPLLSSRGFLLAFPVLLLAVIVVLRQTGATMGGSMRFALVLLCIPVLLFFAADWLNDVLKDLFDRQRPCQALEGVRLLVPCPRSYSLPSGHAIASFAFAASFFILTRGLLSNGWRWYLLTLAGMIAFSRVYIGVHYPLDIAAGSLLGTGLAAAVSVPLLRLSPRSKCDAP